MIFILSLKDGNFINSGISLHAVDFCISLALKMSITSLEVELWEEPFEIPNENGRKNSYVPNYNASQYLKEIQLRNRAKAFNGNLDDTSVYRDGK